MEQTEKYTYWKRPWHKWLIFGVGILQLLALWMNISDLKEIAGVWERIGLFGSAAEWEHYVAGQYLQCALNGLMAAIFLGNFIKGFLVKSKSESDLADIWFMAFYTVSWGILGVVLKLTIHFTWRMLMILSLVLSIYSVMVYIKRKK